MKLEESAFLDQEGEMARERARSDDEILSPREVEIAELIALGLTNSEIAQQLVISRRTVETHVDHIKAKLGFSRRARIVAWALSRFGGPRPTD